MLIIESKRKKGLCVAYRCKNKPQPGQRFCAKHKHRYQKENNHLSYTFSALKQNARRRGKKFLLTIEEFAQFCRETGYLEKKGKSSLSASIDRIDNDGPYSLKNIRILSLSDNACKSDKEDLPF